jgi:tetratricopeptide (TPR) repeat protein
MKTARKVAQEAIAADADQVSVEQALADAALASGDFDEAETALIKVSKDAPTFTSMMNLGSFYSDTRKYDRAMIAYQHAIELDPNSAPAYFRLAEAEEASFDFAGANRDYAHAIKLSPDSDNMQQAYRDFQERVAQGHKPVPGG